MRQSKKYIMSLLTMAPDGRIGVKDGHQGEVADWLMYENDVMSDNDKGELVIHQHALNKTFMGMGPGEALDFMLISLGWQLPGVDHITPEEASRRNVGELSDIQLDYMMKGEVTDQVMIDAGFVWDDDQESWIREDPNEPLIIGHRSDARPEIRQDDPDALIEESNRILAEAYGIEDEDYDSYFPMPEEVLGNG